MPRLQWAVPCTALRHDHQPCGSWSVRGCYVCRKHGITTATRRAGEARLLRLEVYTELLKEFRAFAAEQDARDAQRKAGRARLTRNRAG